MNEVTEENPIVSKQAAHSKANHDDEEANNDKREKLVEKENFMKAGLEDDDEAAALPWIGVDEEGKKDRKFPAASL